MSEEAFVVPAELQSAVDAGEVDKVKELLKTPPDGMSKALQKKLTKNAEIAAKKNEKLAAKGDAPAAPAAQPKAAKPSRPESAPPAAPGKAAAPAPAPAPAMTLATGHSGPEDLIVNDLLACLQTLALPEEAMTRILDHRGALAEKVKTQVNALRNAAYTEGFTAR